jgi:O-antigen/teichoic acid export membrane protein
MGINLAISIPFSTPGAVLAGLQKYSQINAISVAWAAVSAITTISILLTGGGLVEVVAAAIPITLVMEAITAICVYRLAPDLHLSWRGARRDLIREVFSFSASVLVMNISYSLQAKSDEIVIGAFLPVSAVSPYSLARRLSSLPQLFAERFLWAFLPLSSQLKAEGEAELLKALYLTGTRITLAICLPLAAVIITMAGPLLTLWIGERFSAYAPIVVILTLASVLQVSSWPGGTILQGLARHHGLAAMSACATVATICLSIVLVRPYGLLGVAIGTLLPTTILIFGWKMSYSMRVLNVTLRELLIQSLLPVLWPSLLMTFLLIGLRWVAGPLGWLTVGFIAATCLSVFGVVYLWFFSGESERQLVLKAFAAVTPSSGAAK